MIQGGDVVISVVMLYIVVTLLLCFVLYNALRFFFETIRDMHQEVHEERVKLQGEYEKAEARKDTSRMIALSNRINNLDTMFQVFTPVIG